MQTVERVMKALANRRRLAILRYLARAGTANVADLADALHLSVKATSRHLQQLSAAGLVDRQPRWRYVYYRIEPATPDHHRLLRVILSFGRMRE